MPVFRDVVDPLIGAVVPVQASITQKERRDRWKLGLPVPQAIDVLALIDTGAECSCLSIEAVRKLELPLKAINFVIAPAIIGMAPTVFREIDLTLTSQDSALPFSRKWPSLQIVELDLKTLGYEAIIGRDVLSDCVLEYNGVSQSFTLTF